MKRTHAGRPFPVSLRGQPIRHAGNPPETVRPFGGEPCASQGRPSASDAFEAVFREYYEGLVHFIEIQIRDRDVAEELVQEIFLDIWVKGPEWPTSEALRPYLYGAARKKCLMHFRTGYIRGRWQSSVEEDPVGGDDPEVAFRSRELSRLANEAIADLPERRRMIFVLSRHEGLSYAEISEVLDISVSTVRNQMAHALRALRDRLGPYLFAPY